MVREMNDKYYVYSKSGRRLSRAYPTREAAERRLRQIEFFKYRDRR